MAQTSKVPKTCDVEFHDVLRTKAWMEAQREIEVAQTLILKPERVLDYSCFEERADAFAKETGFGNKEDREAEADGTDGFLQKQIEDAFAPFAIGCVSMASVWESIRCSDTDRDKHFLEFSELVSGDTRSCSNAVRDQQWTDALALYEPADFRALNKGGTDKMATFLDNLNPAACGSSAIVETGVVYEVGSVKREDYICVAPGCYYNGSSCQ